MLAHLIRKDILIAKKHVLVSMLVIIAIPIFVISVAPSAPPVAPFIYMVVLGEVLLLQAISQEEAKHPKTIALLCATPYQRGTFVLAKYALFMLVFIYCTLVYFSVSFLIEKRIVIDLTSFLAVLFIGAIIFGIYMPIEFKYGVVNAKFIFMIIILLFSSGPALFMNIFGNTGLDLSVLESLSSSVKNTVLALGSLLALSISMIVTMRIFAKKEL